MKSKSCLVALTPAILLPLAEAAQSQQVQQPLEEVVVFGSLTQRADYVSPSPVFTIDRSAILQDGTPTLSGFLNRSPQFSPAFDRTSNNPGSGRGEVDLRGLGSKRTLVMLNGRRLGPAGSDGAVDVNVIPATLVENIEVLTGGASSVYGSDAVAGVVNVNLKRNYDGLEVSGGYDVTEEDDGDTWNLSVAGGFAFAEERGRVTAFIARTERDEIETSARDFSAFPLSEDFATGSLDFFGSPVSPSGWIPIPGVVDGVFAADGLTFRENGDARAFDFAEDSYNYYGEFNYLQTALERDTAGLFSNFRFTDALNGYFDVTWSNIETDTEIAPIPAFTFATINLDNPFLTEQASQTLAANYDPEGSGFFVGPYGIRLSQNGPRTVSYDRESWHTSLGLEGRLSESWNWQASYTYTENTADIVRGNQILASRFDQSFLVDPATGQCFDPSNGCVGGNYFGPGKLTPELLGFLRGPNLEDRETTDQYVFQVLLRGDVTLYDNHTVSLAIGAEYREDSSEYRLDPAALDGDILASGAVTSGNKGDYDVSEAYLEMVVPLLSDYRFAQQLLLDLGGRYSDYSSTGSAPSWKAGLTWELGDGLLVRVMTQRAVRAPNIQELFASTTEEFSGDALFGFAASDPCSASEDPVGAGVDDICIAQGLAPEQVGVFEANLFYPTIVRRSGNEDLEAEEADTLTAGFTWQPSAIEGFSLAFDYYSVEIDNAITTLQSSDLLNNCFALGNPSSAFCQAASRDSTGNVASINVAPLNAAELTSKGYDLQLEYRMDLPPFRNRDASISVSVVGNRSTEYGFRADPAAAFLDCEGFFGFPCDFTSTGSNPEYRVNTSISYQLGGFGATAIWRWIDSMENAGVYDEFFSTVEIVQNSGTQNYFDLNFFLDLGDRVSIQAGVNNLTDRDPPLLGFNSQQSNTNPNLYDVLGRRYHASIQVRL